MSQYSDVILSFDKEGDALSADDLAQFLASFNRIYEGALLATAGSTAGEALEQHEKFLPQTISHYFTDPSIRRLPDQDSLLISHISYNSPLEIAVYGVSAALIVALILAGGEIKIFGATVKIQKSLGASLRDLRDSLRTPLAPRQTAKSSEKKLRLSKSVPEIEISAALPASKLKHAKVQVSRKRSTKTDT